MPETSSPQVTIYTDGGADPNPGPGGWGAVLLVSRSEAGGEDVEVREISGHEPLTTNNRMELMAAIGALESLSPGSRVDLFTDSVYLRKGVSEWLPGWIARGWRRQSGELLNEDLWRRLAPLAAAHQVTWRWVKGHAGHRWNERADQLATQAIRRQRAAGAAATAALPPGAAPAREGDASGACAAAVALPPSPAAAEVFLRVANPPGGRGGWAALLRLGGAEGANGTEEVLSGSATVASANALDLAAAAAALERLPAGQEVAVYTGSDYLRNGARQWLAAWKSGGWKTREGSLVKNRELWQRLDILLAARRVFWPDLDDAARVALERLAPVARDAARGAPPAGLRGA